MKVKISLHGTLRKKHRDLMDSSPVMSKASSVGQLLAELGLTRAEAPIVFVNDRRAGHESLIKDGDLIKIFPVLGGG